ncbi:MAG: lactoylglutathione lyase [Acidimicrobiales bacterium]
MTDDAARRSFAATGIVVADLERAARFYKEVMGMQELQRVAVPDLQLEEIILSFAAGRGAAIVLMHYTDSVDRGFVDIGEKLVMYVEDPVALAAAVRDAGLEVTREPSDGGPFGLVGFVKDPDGHTIELLQLPVRS